MTIEPAPALVADDAELELKLRWFALPVALLVAWVVTGSGLKMVLRTFLSMWVHETGHAMAAWLCGFGAFPGPWFTPVFEDRSVPVTVVFASAVGWLVYRAWTERRLVLAGTGVAVLLVQAACTLLPPQRVQAFIIFSGDGGCFVLGTLLMASFYVRRDSRIFQDGLRWGFLMIGSAAFMDAFRTWWGALQDVDRIPFGEIVGVALSDPTRLTDEFGWSLQDMVHRYEWLSMACLAILAVIYAKGIMQARAWTGESRRPPSSSTSSHPE
ncbi:MAG TPA: hypothetical protein VI298_13170 [Geobacteraceae bacterium]